MELELLVTFNELKSFLTQLRLLDTPREGETLFLYLVATVETKSSIMIQEENREQVPIYYTSQVLKGVETRYKLIEKLAYVVLLSL